MDSPLPRPRTDVNERTLAPPLPQPGAPSRALRRRAAGGWQRFMRRADFDITQGGR